MSEKKVGRRRFLKYVVAGGVVIAAAATGAYYVTMPRIQAPANATTAGTTAAAKKFRVAFVYSTPLEEPWCTIHNQALLRAVKELGIEYHYTDNAGEADIERITREYATEGYDLVYTDASYFEEGARVMAKGFPNIAFMGWSLLGPSPPNFGTWYEEANEQAYLCGMLASGMSKSGVVGAVAGYSIPPENLILWGFLLGAQEVNPAVKFKLSYIESWYDPVKAKEAALSQIDVGADVIFAERYGVIEACASSGKGVLAVGYMVDQHDVAPGTVITSAVVDPYPMHKEAINLVRAGAWQPVSYGDWTLMSRGGGDIAPYREFEDKIPTALKAQIQAKKKDIMSGAFVVPVDMSEPPSN